MFGKQHQDYLWVGQANQIQTSAMQASSAPSVAAVLPLQILTSVATVASNSITTQMLTNMPETAKHLQIIKANPLTEAFTNMTTDYLLRSAAFCGATEVITELLEAGAHIDTQDENGNTALILASLRPYHLRAVEKTY